MIPCTSIPRNFPNKNMSNQIFDLIFFFFALFGQVFGKPPWNGVIREMDTYLFTQAGGFQPENRYSESLNSKKKK